MGGQVAKIWQSLGDRVHVVTRSEERAEGFRSAGFLPMVGDVTKPESLDFLPVCDTVLVAIGVDRTTKSSTRDVLVDGFQRLLRSLPHDSRQIIYVSSTGVYGTGHHDWVTEETEARPSRDGAKSILEAEAVIGLPWVASVEKIQF